MPNWELKKKSVHLLRRRGDDNWFMISSYGNWMHIFMSTHIIRPFYRNFGGCLVGSLDCFFSSFFFFSFWFRRNFISRRFCSTAPLLAIFTIACARILLYKYLFVCAMHESVSGLKERRHIINAMVLHVKPQRDATITIYIIFKPWTEREREHIFARCWGVSMHSFITLCRYRVACIHLIAYIQCSFFFVFVRSFVVVVLSRIFRVRTKVSS